MNPRKRHKKEQKRADRYAKLKRRRRAAAAKERRLEKDRRAADKDLEDRLNLIGPPEVIDLPTDHDKPDVFDRSGWSNDV